ncbi:MAG: hypothetical protein U1F76_16325 [Candidatus Competibacteraceae bacterium]
MRINLWLLWKAGAVLIAILAVFLVALTPYEAAKTSKNKVSSSRARGQALFADTCSPCHSARPRPFKTAPEPVPQRLHDPRIHLSSAAGTPAMTPA